MIHYTVSIENTNNHLIDLHMVITRPLTKGQEFWLPDWIPGSYMIRDFSRNIMTLIGRQNDRIVKISKRSKSVWRLDEDVECLEIDYQVYAWDLSVRSAHFDDQHCFFNGTSTFLAVRGLEGSPHQIKIIKPSYGLDNQWKVATSMPDLAIDVDGFGEYQSGNYAELIDHPFEITDFIETKFVVDDIEHRMIFAEAPENVDLKRIAQDVQSICQYECSFFADSKPPFDQYLFMTFVQKQGFGGLEHMSSTALHCSHGDLPRLGDDPTKKTEDYQKFLALCSHEYFHCWNVKRIKPARFETYQLQQEVHTELLWFFEGVTSYYDELFLVRCGVITSQNYLDMLAKNITRYLRGKGRQKQTVTESSFDTWTKFYKQDENAANVIVSYYVKGGLVAFCLDFEIRRLTDNDKNLDDLMRLIWQKHGQSGVGVDEAGIQKLATNLVGTSMQDFFRSILYSTEELDLQRLFTQLGINYQLLPESKQMDKGGYVKRLVKRNAVSSLNITHKANPVGAETITVLEGGCAANIGLSNKDIIIALDGYRVNSGELDKRIAAYPLESEIQISFFRRDKMHHRICVLRSSEANTCYLSFKEKQSNSAFNDWINLIIKG